MDQQLSAIVKILSNVQVSVAVPNLCFQPKSSLITRLISDRLLNA